MWKAVTELLLFKSVLQLYYASGREKGIFPMSQTLWYSGNSPFFIVYMQFGEEKGNFF